MIDNNIKKDTQTHYTLIIVHTTVYIRPSTLNLKYLKTKIYVKYFKIAIIFNSSIKKYVVVILLIRAEYTPIFSMDSYFSI